MSDQLTLFTPASSTVAALPDTPMKDRFLTANAQVFDSLSRSTTLGALAKRAVDEVRQEHNGKTSRDSAKPFELRLRSFLRDPEHAEAIASETIADAAERHPDLKLVTFRIEDGGDDAALADITVVLRREGRKTARVAVNIKRLGCHHTDACSIGNLIQLATDIDYDPNPNRSFDVDRAVLEMLTGRRRIQAERDYWLLIVKIDSGEYTGIEPWGTLIHRDRKGRTILSRHVSRGVARARRPAGTLSDDVDPNIDIAEALLPRYDSSSVRALLVQAIRNEQGLEAAQAAAAKLLDLDDDEMLGAITKALGLTPDD